MKLILIDPKAQLCEAWQKSFQNLPNVEITQGYFEQLPEFDCIVSAGNSFGMMDGGVDLAIANFFGQSLVKRVQERILSEYLGEQPVGTSIIVPTGNQKHPFVAHTPTMRVPQPIAHTDQVYSAMWGMFLAVYHHNQTSNHRIKILACPGLGTTTGKMAYDEAAEQMAMAYENFLNPPKAIDWMMVTARRKPFNPYAIAINYSQNLQKSQS